MSSFARLELLNPVNVQTTTSANNSKHNCQPTTTSQPHFGLSRHGTRTLDDFTAGERVIPSEPLAGFEGQ